MLKDFRTFTLALALSTQSAEAPASEIWYCAFAKDQGEIPNIEEYAIDDTTLRNLTYDLVLKKYLKEIRPNDFFGDSYAIITNDQMTLTARSIIDGTDKSGSPESAISNILLDKRTGTMVEALVTFRILGQPEAQTRYGSCKKADAR
jgi:hypothetical protein